MSEIIDLGDGSVVTGPWKTARKTATVQAVQMPFPFRVKTLHGVAEAQAGDWLMRGDHGESWPCAASVFDATYTIVDSACECGCDECADGEVEDFSANDLMELLGVECVPASEVQVLDVGPGTTVSMQQLLDALGGK